MEMKLEKSREEEIMDDGGSVEVVRWERFLPKMVLRVLLVESDDSTRRIISALLRKCSYRVAAVSDGLQAWETIRARPQSIDIIMTEVDLPSISGYALLTLVKEHEVCKNIPVIMMSAKDSVSEVFKYMLRGAGDFLIKPLRSNELRNLWQHVWRRQTLHSDHTLSKAVASFENNEENNCSSDFPSPRQKHKECSEKEGDTQSSCTRPYVEVESAYAPNMQDLTSLKSRSSSILSTIGEAEHEPSGTLEGRSGEMEFLSSWINSWINSCDDECNELSSRAIDLIATIDVKQKGMEGVCSHEKIESAPKLELSLRQTHPSFNTPGTDEMKSLNHSNASAFSLYTSSKTWQPYKSNAPSLNKISEDKSTLPRHGTSHTGNSENQLLNDYGQLESPFTSPRVGMFPVPGVNFDDAGAGYNQAVQSIFFAQYGLGKPLPESTEQVYVQSHDTINNSRGHTELKKDVKKASEKPRHGSPAAPHSTSSILCNETLDRSWQEGLKGPDSSSQFMSQREAALNKFRLKRKDRCYEKKVRYQSRKKLAEQRPRVKGQFARQIKADLPTTDARCS